MKTAEEKIQVVLDVERRRVSRGVTARMVAVARRGGLAREALAAQLGLTTERIRQLEARGEAILKAEEEEEECE